MINKLKIKDLTPESPPESPNLSIDKILEQGASIYAVDLADLNKPHTKTAARDTAIYLCRQPGGYDLKTIARQFNISYARVSQIVDKVRAGAKSNNNFQELLRALGSDTGAG